MCGVIVYILLWKSLKVLFHFQFQKNELPLSHIRILEEPLAVLSGPLRVCGSDLSGERKKLCSEFPALDSTKAISIYRQSLTNWKDFYINNNYKHS